MNVEKLLSLRNLSFNPYEVLGVSKDARDEEIFEAYGKRRSDIGDGAGTGPLVEEAFQCLRDERSRILFKFLSPTHVGSIEEAEGLFRPRLKYLGPGIWMRAIRELNEEREKGELR